MLVRGGRSAIDPTTNGRIIGGPRCYRRISVLQITGSPPPGKVGALGVIGAMISALLWRRVRHAGDVGDPEIASLCPHDIFGAGLPVEGRDRRHHHQQRHHDFHPAW